MPEKHTERRITWSGGIFIFLQRSYWLRFWFKDWSITTDSDSDFTDYWRHSELEIATRKKVTISPLHHSPFFSSDCYILLSPSKSWMMISSLKMRSSSSLSVVKPWTWIGNYTLHQVITTMIMMTTTTGELNELLVLKNPPQWKNGENGRKMNVDKSRHDGKIILLIKPDPVVGLNHNLIAIWSIIIQESGNNSF